MGINRNIVECKYSLCGGVSMKCRRINRNIVECKYVLMSALFPVELVLIETLWNVN